MNDWHRRALGRLVSSAPRLFAIALFVYAVPFTALGVAALFVTVPPSLTERPAERAFGPRQTSLRVLDRRGDLLAEPRAADDARAGWLMPDEAGLLVPALLAAEDKRFLSHNGFDPLASARALWSSIARGRLTSGASTLSQQLARVESGAPRTLTGKLYVLALAFRIEATLSKQEILEQYLGRVDFGAQVRGARAASELYFGKHPRSLSLAEAAALASLPQSPSRFDPRSERGRAGLRRRRDEVLVRIERARLAASREARLAREEPLVLAPRARGVDAPHFVRALVGGRLLPCRQGEPIGDDVAEVTTTIDPDLQEVAVTAAQRVVEREAHRGVSAASVLVVDNERGQILAYVGSPDPRDEARLGANDGVRAARQPGSALKPFLYALAVERLQMSPATLLPDVELAFSTKDGEYRPNNYDGRFHGPVLMREALGNSYNVPAVWVTEQLGVAALVERLRDLGFCSLDRAPEHYGLALALGDAEVTLLELARGAAALARGGSLLELTFVLARRGHDAVVVEPALPKSIPVIDPRAAALVTDVLADPVARRAAFGEDGVLELSFPAAVKTGTSKGFRDNLALGYTRRVTVAVWVGNFDGRPMRGVSGVAGAGPLLAEVLSAAAAAYPAEGFVLPDGIERVEVCALSGALAGSSCPSTRLEPVVAGQGPSKPCAIHQFLWVDGEGLAGASCEGARRATFEVWPRPFRAWALAVGRPSAPRRASPRCAPDAGSVEAGLLAQARQALAILFPRQGERLLIDRAQPTPPAVRLRAEVPSGTRAWFVFEGGERIAAERGAALWRLERGAHRLFVELEDGSRSAPVGFRVD